MAANISHLKKYAVKLNEKMDLDRKLKAVEAELGKLEQPVLDYFQAKGLDKLTVEGRTLYLRRDLFTSKAAEVSTEVACKQLKKMGLDDYVGTKINTQGLGAWVREREAANESLADLRANFAGAFNIAEVFKVGHTKAESKPKHRKGA